MAASRTNNERTHMPTGMAMLVCTAEDTTILSANAPARLLPGIARAEQGQGSLFELLPDETAKLVHKFMKDKSVCGGNSVYLTTLSASHADTDSPLHVRMEVELVVKSSPPLLMASFEEVGKGRRCNYEELVNQVQSVILRISPDGIVRFINAYGVRFFGFEPAEIIGHSIYDTIVPPQDGEDSPLPNVFRSLARDEEHFKEHQNLNIRKNGEEVWMSWSNRPIFDSEGEYMECISVGVDVTDERRMQQNLKFQAERDTLTGLYNRAHMLTLIDEAITKANKSGSTLAVCFIDMDRFKFVNDSMGHDFGDKVLREIGQRLKDFAGPNNYVGRFGSDEFILLGRDIGSPRKMGSRSRELLTKLSAPYGGKDGQFHLTPSVGMVLSPPVQGTAEELLQWSNMATRRAKNKGGKKFRVFNKAMLEATQRKLDLEGGLLRGLAAGEFRLVFQPIYSIRGTDTPVLSGCEALLRWKHPTLGNISPGEFIPLAEQSGRISALFQWVLDSACATFAEWSRTYPAARGMSISINVSGRQLNMAGLSSRVRTALQSSGLENRQLTLEVTETAIMADPVLARSTLAGLQEQGVGISVDDFGTGYSSMSYLRLLPLDTLKIDLSFVQKMHVSEDDTMIVKTIINLAHSLGLAVVAEGVELDEHLRILNLLDCDKAQGYYLSRPLEAKDFEALLSDRNQ